MKEITIGANDAGQRLDRFLAKAVPLLPASLAQKYIRLKRIKLDGKARSLVHQEDVLILVDDAELGRRHGQVGIVLPGLVEKLVVDIQLKQVALLKPGVALRSCIVQLDPLDADVLLGQGGRQQRHRLGQKPVEALTGIVLFDFEFFHFIHLWIFFLIIYNVDPIVKF